MKCYKSLEIGPKESLYKATRKDLNSKEETTKAENEMVKDRRQQETNG